MTASVTKVDEFIKDGNNSFGSNSPLPKLNVTRTSSSTTTAQDLGPQALETLILKEKLLNKVNGHVSSFYIRDSPETDPSQTRFSFFEPAGRTQDSKGSLSPSPERRSIPTLPTESDSPNKMRRTSNLRVSSIEHLSTEFELERGSSPSLHSKFRLNSMVGSQIDLQTRKDSESSLNAFPLTMVPTMPSKTKTTANTEILSTKHDSQTCQKNSRMSHTRNSLSVHSIPKLNIQSSPDVLQRSEIKRYKFLCRTLKLDKIFRAKDHIDSSLADAKPKSRKYSENLELSAAIDSLTVKDLPAYQCFSPAYHNESFSKEDRRASSLMRRKLKTMIL